jgi:hypothetical protein
MSAQRCLVSSRSATADSNALIVVPRARSRCASRSRIALSTLIVVVGSLEGLVGPDTLALASR